VTLLLEVSSDQILHQKLTERGNEVRIKEINKRNWNYKEIMK
jgi:hypothetical protein